jgi:hypothetical protein
MGGDTFEKIDIPPFPLATARAMILVIVVRSDVGPSSFEVFSF